MASVRVGSRRVRVRQSDLDAFLDASAAANGEADALRDQLTARLDDARAAVGDDAQLAPALRSLASAATRLARARQWVGALLSRSLRR
jgi:ElaB/YqjD/DUF883 family membrane-anchored ribosome-binding protein